MRLRLPWILFAVSLTLNLAIAGAFGWHLWHGSEALLDRAPVMQAANSLRLEGVQRQKLDQFRQTARHAIELRRQNVRPMRRELLDQLSKPSPDFDAVDRMIDQIGDEQGKVQKTMVRAFAEFHASLTPDQRQEFRKRLRERAGGRLLDAIVNPGDPDGRPPRRGPDGAPGGPRTNNPAAPAPATAPAPAVPAPAPAK